MAKSACASSVVSSKWSTAQRLSSCLLYLDPKHVCAATRQSVQAEELQQSMHRKQSAREDSPACSPCSPEQCLRRSRAQQCAAAAVSMTCRERRS